MRESPIQVPEKPLTFHPRAQQTAGPGAMTSSQHAYEVRPRKDRHGVLMKLRVAILLAASLAGCAPTSTLPPAPPHYNVAVESEPAGAVIEVNGDYRGRTPCVISVVATSAGTVPWPGLTV